MTGDSVTYDSESDRYHVEFDLEEPNAVPDTIVFALAEIRDIDPIELTPLGDVVDPDALGSIFQPAAKTDNHVSITFDYGGYVVTVNDTGTVSFEDME